VKPNDLVNAEDFGYWTKMLDLAAGFDPTYYTVAASIGCLYNDASECNMHQAMHDSTRR
jgi:hypothetical protein